MQAPHGQYQLNRMSSMLEMNIFLIQKNIDIPLPHLGSFSEKKTVDSYPPLTLKNFNQAPNPQAGITL